MVGANFEGELHVQERDSRAVSLAIGFAALLVAVRAAPSAREAPDAPAIWKIDGPKGDIYLFGSVHLLPQGVNWRTPALDAALNEAKVVVFEIDLEEAKNLAIMQQLIAKLGVLPAGQTLANLLSPEGRAKFERVLGLLGIPAASLDPLRPWLASITIGVQWIVSKGYDPNSGVDDKVWNLAKQNGKQLAHLETIEEQLDVFAGLTRDQEIELLARLGRSNRKFARNCSTTSSAAWRKGDTAKLDKVLNADMDDTPGLARPPVERPSCQVAAPNRKHDRRRPHPSRSSSAPPTSWAKTASSPCCAPRA